MTFPLSGVSRNLGAGDEDLSIDFDLAAFTVVNGKVVPTLHEGEHNSLRNTERQETGEVRGIITNLAGSAPDFSFLLTGRNSPFLPVQTSTTTQFLNESATAPSALTNGKRVEVRGVYDVTTDRFVATVVKIEDEAESHNAEARVEGAASAGNSTAGTFTVTMGRVRGFLPTQTSVLVITTANTVLQVDNRLFTAPDFYAALSGTSEVEVEGVYDATANTLTATRARIRGGHGEGSHGGHDDGNEDNSGKGGSDG